MRAAGETFRHGDLYDAGFVATHDQSSTWPGGLEPVDHGDACWHMGKHDLMPRIVIEQEPDAHISSARRADYAAAA